MFVSFFIFFINVAVVIGITQKETVIYLKSVKTYFFFKFALRELVVIFDSPQYTQIPVF